MHKLEHRGHGAPRAAAVLLWHALVVASISTPSPAHADCLGSTNPQIRQLQALVAADANQALKQARGRLDTLERATPTDAQRIAALYAVLAQSYNILELDGAARDAASKGLALATGATDPVHLDLLSAYAESVYDEAGLKSAIGSIEAARTMQPRGSLADTCLLITRGLLQYRQDRADLAIVSLMQAYRASTAPVMTEAHIDSAEVLSIVMRGMGDYSQALALNQQVIDWDTAHGATLSLSVSRFLRGQILKQMGQYSGAIDEFTQARMLSQQVEDRQGIAFADLRTCEAQIELGELVKAKKACDSASRTFTATHSTDDMKETEVLLARIDLGEGRADQALVRLNGALDHGGADMPPRSVTPLFEWRARTNAALQNFHDAYMDLDEFVTRYEAANDAQRTREAGALRARFATDREIERNASLQRELELSQDRSQRQAQELRWNAIVALSGVLVIALLMYFLVANLRYRQQLLRLAREDGLTGLPNRRRTAELAIAALATASATQRPLTVALIDLDHFKIINDRCGHAAGDRVLQEFARVGRETLRASDILGRWGGEEFLLVMPEATLDLALASLERLRVMVFGIALPETGAGLQVSMCAGLATYEHDVKSLDDLIARADSALYRAKNQGRDLVRIAEQDYQNASSGIRRALR
jgi:diguanylate cyclase (GGDEF)-like protein